MAASKSLSPEQNQFARERVRELIQRKWGGDQTLAALAFRVSQPTISEFLSGAKGIGPKLLNGVMQVDARVGIAILGGAAAADGAGAEVDGEPRAPEAAGGAPVRVYTPERQEQRESGLAKARERLYRRYPERKAQVDAVIGGSEFIGMQDVSEADAYETLDDLMRMIKAESKGKLITGPTPEHPKEPPPAADSRKGKPGVRNKGKFADTGHEFVKGKDNPRARSKITDK